MTPHILTRLDNRFLPPVQPDEVRLFSVIRNEMLRLPDFISHYRKLGVHRFIFVDNNSSDGSKEWLLQQPDCHVFHTDAAYSAACSGIEWTNQLLALYGTGHWCLIADADELLIYPACEQVKLPEFCRFLDEEGAETFFTFLLDMYPEGDLAEAQSDGRPLIEVSPFFDRDYTFVDRIHLRGPAPFPRQEVIGGPRTRCFYRDQGAHSFTRRLFMHIIERGISFLRRHSIPMPYIRLKATPLFKLPLIKWKSGLSLTASTHCLQPVPLSSVSGVLLHFKFLSDFDARVKTAVQHGQFAQNSIEYKQYLKKMEAVRHLMYAGSLRYTSSQDVVKAGLMHSSAAYDRFLAHTQTSTGLSS